jgi:hypothetical protein
MNFTKNLFIALVACSSLQVGSSAVISVDFSAETMEDRFNGYLGGWYGSNLDFDQWYGDAAGASISGSELIVTSTAPDGLRSSVVLLDPSIFAASGAGDYQLSFNLTDFSMSDNNPNTGDDFAFASVWSGSGYDLSGTSGDALFVSPGMASITPQGNAVTSEIARSEYAGPGNNLIVDFTYDGFSAIAIFLGVGDVGGWPFPTANFSNPEVSEVSAVPEPKMIAFLFMMAACLGMRRFSTQGAR